MEVDHIGYLTKDINRSVIEFEKIGYKKTSDFYVDNKSEDGKKPRNTYLCFLENGHTKIELVSPINEDSVVFNTLKRQGEGPYHICYRVLNIEETMEEMKKDGWMTLKQPEKAIAFHNSRVVFMFKSGMGMVELVEINV